jgi:hypothetical protein
MGINMAKRRILVKLSHPPRPTGPIKAINIRPNLKAEK